MMHADACRGAAESVGLARGLFGASAMRFLRMMAGAAIPALFMIGCYQGHRDGEPPAHGAGAGAAASGRSSAGTRGGSSGTNAAGGSGAGSTGGSSAAGGGPASDGGAGDDAAGILDGGALGPFELSCRAYTELPRPACGECLGNVQLACSSVLTQFERECGGAARCASRNCFQLCTRLRPCGAFCDCALSCLPPGESACKARWQELLTCYTNTCAGTC